MIMALPRRQLLVWIFTALGVLTLFVNGFTVTQNQPVRRTQLFSTRTLPEGVTKQIRTKANADSTQQLRLGDILTVDYTAHAIDDKDEKILISRGTSQKRILGDPSMIPGWDYGVRSMAVGESAIFSIDSELAYGESGIPGLVPAGANVQLDITLTSATPATANIDFDALAEADATPRTAADIAAAYATRQANRGTEEELEGMDWFINKAKNFYFYGLFEGETGERPPWFLRPSITFPIAFVIVGAAFAVSLLSGAITERGAPVTDELDEIILSSLLVLPMLLQAL